MDVVSLAQFGIRYGVATLGTACGEDHLERAFRYTNEVVFCFDGDKAGRAAAHRALESSLASMKDGRLVKFLFLPDGEDPDTLVRQIGPEKFEHMISLAVPLEDFLFDAVAEGINIRTMEGRASFSKRAAPFLDRLPKGVFRELMFENLATRTGLSRSVLQDLVSAPATLGEPAPTAWPSEKTPQSTPARIAGHTQLHPKIVSANSISRDRSNESESNYGQNNYSNSNYSEDEYLAREMPPPDYEEYYSEPQTRVLAGRPFQPQLAPSLANKYLMPPARKAIALLLTYPSLAASEMDHNNWLNSDDSEWQILGRLLKLLHERSHYNSAHILGYWLNKYEPSETEFLGSIFGHDLLQAANALTLSRQDRPAKADYDTVSAFCDCMQKLRQEQDKRQRNQTLATAHQTDFRQLTTEQKALIRAALTRPTTGEN
jgi:DNA primase